MAESFIDNRVVFPVGTQREFLLKTKALLGLSQMARLCGCSERTVRDWMREKFRMPGRALNILATKTGIQVPPHTLQAAYAHTSEAGKKGQAKTLERHGQPAYRAYEARRKEKWREWWETTGQFHSSLPYVGKQVRMPRKSAALAEFVGIMMGDGGLSKYQATITLHHLDDLAYSQFVIKLCRTLFSVTPHVYHVPKHSVNNIVISRVKLVEYLHALGLPIGNKIRQGIDIPNWVTCNRNYLMACIRGLVDTDGCIFTHSYVVKGKRYAYKKLLFTSASTPLINTVYESMRALGLHPRLTRARTDVRLDAVEDVRRYFEIVGTHNPKHLKRYESTIG